jgi:diguanylate cyclase (GGDEF)-like protein
MPVPLRVFVASVCAAGLLVVAVCVRNAGSLLADADVLVVLFGFAILLAELYPLDLPGHQGQATYSTAFAFALLLADGIAAVILVHVVTVMMADVVRRRPVAKIFFNAAQYALSWAAAGTVLHAFGAPAVDRAGLEYLQPSHLPALAAAALVFLLVNTVLASTAPALANGASPLAYIRADFGFQLTMTTVLMALVPIVLVLGAFDLTLIPLLWLPLAAIQVGGRQAVINAHQARHDALTGLPNRTQLHERLSSALAAAGPGGGGHVGVLLMDLDGFKEINDTLGHHHGDVLLQQVADRLRASMRPGDLVARLGGDEFALLLPDITGTDDAVAVAQRTLATLEGPAYVQGVELDVRGSVGVACFPEHGSDVDELLSGADMAMYSAKQARSGWALYDEALNQHTPERLALVSDLRRGLERDELMLEYQPKLDLATGEVCGVEALVRWRHPERGVMPPAEFVGLAEQTGLIRPLTMWVVREALRQTQRWRAEGLELRVAINLSVRSLTRELPDAIAALLLEHGATGHELEFEITESMMMANPAEGLEILQELSDLGLRLAVDDFGTGYSSLAYLKRLPVSELKIDNSFVREMDVDASDRGIVRSTIDLARHLGLSVVAEGVESAATLAELRDLGCNSAQGFFISPPLPPKELAAWVAMQLPESTTAFARLARSGAAV